MSDDFMQKKEEEDGRKHGNENPDWDYPDEATNVTVISQLSRST